MSGLPFVTAGLEGSGGTLRATPEDFRVDEVPAYLPSGAGPHLYVRDREARPHDARRAPRPRARSSASPSATPATPGSRTRTRSRPSGSPSRWRRIPTRPRSPGPGSRVLEVSRHANKLRPGHVRANRFSLAVRGGDPGRARAAAAALLERGLPNFFGPQRFGAAGRNAEVGRALLRGEATPEARRAARDRFLRRFSISAYQAELFNRWLAARMADGLFAAALAGDVMKKLDTGGLFTCDDPAADGPRVERFEISPAGPMFGHKLRPAAGEALAREERVLAADGMTLADFARGGGEAEGTRRAARLRVEVRLEPLEDGYRADFELPKGSYATVVMRELVKGEADLPEPDEA